MKFFIKPTNIEKLDADLLIIYCWENEFSQLNFSDRKLADLVKEAMEKENFKGKNEQFLSLSTKGYLNAYKLLIVGLGQKDDFNLYNLRKAVAFSVKKAKDSQPAKIGFMPDDFWLKKFTVNEVVQAMVEAVKLSSYRFLKYKSEEEKRKRREIEDVAFLLPPAKIPSDEKALKWGEIYGEATCFARDLVNEPAMVTTPSHLADVASAIGKEHKDKVKIRIFEKDEIKKLGMEAYLAVAKGSEELPKFIRLSYTPNGARKKVIIVGKGITFDAGGLSLKKSKSMETMKLDMAAAATVLGVFKALPALNIKIQVIGLIPACENMPSGRALKPGDILRSANGKTIEVLNTDAEGRLTLADAFSYAVSKEKGDCLIDLATLTGACQVALGEEIAGLWGNNEELIEKIKTAAFHSGEKIWQMPLEEEYKKLLKSDLADIRNVQLRTYGGAIIAALFLSEFIADIPWVHLDIAGPAFAEAESPLIPKGGSGFGVRLLLNFLSMFC